MCEEGISTKVKMVDPQMLGNYTKFNNICSKQETGFCSKHQRFFAKNVKRARQLYLLPN